MQKTIKNSVKIQGKGLHTGVNVEMTLRPADVDFGYKFKRIDLEKQPIINCIADNVVDTSRGTTLEENGAKISTIEHILATLYAMDIDNVLIEINGEEVPIMDGSAREFVLLLEKAEIAVQEKENQYFELQNELEYKKDEVSIKAYPSGDFSINTLIDYDSEFITPQYANFDKSTDFRTEFANCRTFVFLRELELLLKHNLIKGGDLDNAIVIMDKKVPQEELNRLADLFNKPRIEIQETGVINDKKLQYKNEFARHKLLDLLGDLALVGKRFKANIIATRPGHSANVEFAKIVRQEIKKNRNKIAPKINIYQTPLCDINQIKKMLPHRFPFLLVDKIMEISDKHIVGIKNVTMNEHFFVGHFPGEPVMPGVLQIEAMAQVGGIFALKSVPDPENYITYFMKIDKVKFKQKVVPGDTIVFINELICPIKRGIVQMKGTGFVGEKMVIEGELMAQIVKVK